MGIKVRTLSLPMGYDPDSYVKTFSINELKTNLQNGTIDGLECYYKLSNGRPILQVMGDCLKAVHAINATSEQEFYVKRCADLFHFSVESIKAELKKA
jgi:DNA primase